ncbi:MAG: hypothetical protein ABI779_00960 [Acidobacteriota bacterium]
MTATDVLATLEGELREMPVRTPAPDLYASAHDCREVTNRHGVTQVFSYNGKGQFTRIDRLAQAVTSEPDED